MKLPDLDKLSVVLFPDPILKKVCTPVTEFGPDLKAFTDRMLALMRDGSGVGLAAPQVGIRIRLFVCNPTGEPKDDMVCVNPQFVDLTGAEEKEEGCLSIPGVNVTMRRAQHAVMMMQDTDGQPLERTGEGLLARIWQHESGHLDGRLITDNMSASDEISNRRVIKQLRADYEQSRRRRQKTRCASSS